MQFKLLGLSVALAACAFTTLPAHAIGRLADVTVVDRESGATLPTHYHRGEYWVAGRPGARYAISVRSKIGERVMVVAAVDGVNILSGETASWDQTGYVFSPYERYQITGWRNSNSEVAAFEFSAASDSYAGRTGRPDHVGVLGVALFREQRPEPVAVPEYSRRSESRQDQAAANQSREIPAAPAAAAPSADARGSSESMARSAPPSPTAKLGTGHGQRETSLVSHTSFARQQTQPNEIIRIRYDSFENLVASGVIRKPAPYPAVPGPNAFPNSASTSYVPDPPARHY
ncbi:MAG TPA: hypothetical protein VE934_02005 [Polaromonas sp.]|uniref:hypothetical protein n=1 Tax=Polaromonas sp. TaxID=1869339 RepID=UPI002D6D0634|nr:hypothetical protein [Polaromonas sp.]HYW55710.1 hypothetical protein [Polaromonas sp.]